MTATARAACVIEGYGTMGAVQARLAAALGLNVSCVTKRRAIPFDTYGSAQEALAATNPAYYVITNETWKHWPSLRELDRIGYRGKVLVEKPVCLRETEIGKLPDFPVFIGYCLRFLPSIRRARQLIGDEPLTGARFSVGGHLSGWRPDRNYEDVYSSKRALGGGVLRDLSHELDLALFLCGKPKKLRARIGNWNLKGMDCESWADILLETDKCPAVNIHLDCCDRNPHRVISFYTPTRTITLNIHAGRIFVNGQMEEHGVAYEKALGDQMAAFISGDPSDLCTLPEGMAVMELIGRIEESAAEWEKDADIYASPAQELPE